MVYQFWVVFLLIAIIFIICDRKYGMLRDTAHVNPQPYSWARVQLAWWSAIVLSSFISIFWMKHNLPTLHYSTLVLLGISAATTTTARVIDIADRSTPGIVMHQDLGSSNFILDILSDQNGISIHRFQTVLFNAVFGFWFVSQVLGSLKTCNLPTCIDSIMPVIGDNNLILIGLSSATYAAIKTTENKMQTQYIRPVNTVVTTAPGTTTTTTVSPGPTGAGTGSGTVVVQS
jgi:hypothetical protein